jgi:hypothetical protein
MFFLLLPPKERTKETCLPAGSHRCMKIAKNLRHSKLRKLVASLLKHSAVFYAYSSIFLTQFL